MTFSLTFYKLLLFLKNSGISYISSSDESSSSSSIISITCVLIVLGVFVSGSPTLSNPVAITVTTISSSSASLITAPNIVLISLLEVDLQPQINLSSYHQLYW